jgi:hypothetical protein
MSEINEADLDVITKNALLNGCSTDRDGLSCPPTSAEVSGRPMFEGILHAYTDQKRGQHSVKHIPR